MNFVIDGIRYHVDIIGEGFPLILLHGFTGNTKTWSPFQEKWGKHSKIIAVDIIGHGGTESPTSVDRYNMMSVVKDLSLLMDMLNIGKADFLGYSMGGRLALSFAMAHPHKVRKLVLESATPGIDTEAERLTRIEQDRKLAEFIIERGMTEFVDYWENIGLFQSQKSLPDHTQARVRTQRLENSIIGLSNSLLGMGTGSQPSRWEQLHLLTNETLLITGSLDKKFCEIAAKMTQKIKNVEWVNIKECGHAIHVEESEKFGTIVSRFLSK
ncbi:2-succinyl-6-hydroxy-2,4-cyclohexadiene-1-carboxylate synthase [Bacillus sp. 31A1R]|uniref:Putative 2-succinyl-6-hydroxy-2,4-cyclohexadiene-1-carboxylate synthase n=1 Tax=Robertmurraya mangrovi TaxID=3098077 RepID=A0ABU5IZR0_9BACI|nr:2-succinyl-6-hydroxy-2,4-cyclohexadiene-1-carboxylate synthase [Bacillus sp. 31A1R]MDZ5472626.1 2-succinyl-6-hydroxy-2,4-cyclohexadiene-1-carboxylate synthase [Bacillus sp. 31A1R]